MYRMSKACRVPLQLVLLLPSYLLMPATVAASGALITSSKQVWSGDLRAGGTVTYILLLANQGSGDQPDNPGHEFIDILPPQLVLVGASGPPGLVADTATNTVTWDGAISAGSSIALTIDASIALGTQGQTVTNQGTVSYDADGDGTNESTGLTVAYGGGPTKFVVLPPLPLTVTASKRIVGGDLHAGGSVIYEVILTNSGPGTQPDNPEDEFIDVIPNGLTVGTPTATSGLVSAPGVSPVTWNGSIASNASVTITIPSTIAPNFAGTISNQGYVHFDPNGTGIDDSIAPTDDPTKPGNADATTFDVIPMPPAPPATAAPTLGRFAQLILATLLACIAISLTKPRRR